MTGMRRMGHVGRRLLTLMAVVALSVWTVVPSAAHVPKLLLVPGDHAEMIASHGHSHGLEEDIAWAMHGHSHDKGDHDHSQAVLPVHRAASHPAYTSTTWHAPVLAQWSPPLFRLERPPRA